MPELELIEPFTVQEIFVDGFADYQVKDGVLSCAGYREQRSKFEGSPIRTVVIRIVMPVANLGDGIARALAAASGLAVEPGTIPPVGVPKLVS